MPIVVLDLFEGVTIQLVVSIHRTTYILIDEELILKVPRFIDGNKGPPLEMIESFRRTLLPFDVRLWSKLLGLVLKPYKRWTKLYGDSQLQRRRFDKAQHGSYRMTLRKT